MCVYLSNPPLGQDVTQGQCFSGVQQVFVQSFLSPRLVALSKDGDCSRGRLEGSLFNSYYTKVLGMALLLSLDYSTLPLIRTLYC